jgi:dihydroorotase
MQFKRSLSQRPTFNRQVPAPRPKFERRIVRPTLPDFLCKCTNVINMEKRIAFRVDVPYNSLMACHLCDEDTKKQCEGYNWIEEGWQE